jgi:hypothetical protein
MSKRVNEMDVFEKSIRDNPVKYNVVLFQPMRNSRIGESFDNIDEAIEYSTSVITNDNKIRAAMVYAIDKKNHHALCGTVNRFNKTYKEVEVRI